MRNRFQPSLRIRLLSLVLLALLPAFALIVFHAVEDSRRANAEINDAVRRLVRQAAAIHERLVEEAYGVLGTISNLPEFLLHSPICSNLLANVADRQLNFERLIVVTPAGEVACSNHDGYAGVNFSDRPWFRQAVFERKFVASEYLIGRVTGEPSVYFVAPLLDSSGAVRGAVGMSVRLAWLRQITDQVALPPGSTFTLFDRQGTILARHPGSDTWIGKSFAQSPLFQQSLRAREERTMIAVGLDSVQRLYTFRQLGSDKGMQSWSLAVGIPKDAAYAEARALLLRNLTLMLLVALLVLGVAWLASGELIVRPIRALVDASAKWAAGDLRARTAMENRRDELGQLAGAFDRMAETLEIREADRVKAERVRAQLAAIVETSSDAIISRTVDGVITSWNKGAERLFGYRAEEMIGHSIMLLIPGDDIERINLNFARLARGQRIESYEAVRLRKGGAPIDVSVTASPIVDNSGKVIGVSSISRDISGRKRAENALKALHDINLAITSTLDLRSVLEILLSKIEVRLPYAASHIRLLDKATGALVPMACRNIDEEDWKAGGARFRHEIHRTILSMKRAVVIADLQKDNRVSRADFYRRHGLVSYLGLPLIVKDESIGVLSLLTRERHAFTPHEIQFAETLAKQASVAIHNSQLYDERKRIADQLASSEDQIRALANGLIHARDEEAKRIAHALHDESGQLLAMVYVALDELSRNLAPGDKERVQSIKSLLDDVENRLRELSHELHPAMLDHLGLVPSIDHLANQTAKRNGIQVEVAAALDDRLSPLLELTLFRVVQEAFNNAVRHGRANHIEVRVMQDQELIQCAIRDDGAGFHPAALRGVGKHHTQGLGLAGMRERIESVGGVLEILSAPGEGTKLFITMPREKRRGAQSVDR